MSNSPARIESRSAERRPIGFLLKLGLVIVSLIAATSVASAVDVAAPGVAERAAPAVDRVPVADAPSPPPPPGPAPPEPAIAGEPPAPGTTNDGSPAETPVDPSCRIPVSHVPQGTTSVVSSQYEVPPAATVLRVRIEIEDGVAIEPGCFVETVASILNDPRSWGHGDQFAFQPVTGDDMDFRLVLASPELTDSLCYPLRTGSKYSCRNRDTVVLNLDRWEFGTAEYAEHLDVYRQYLINHEVGHLLGHGHRQCPGAAEPAPVMMQQTKGLGDCSLNGWPTRDER